MRVCQACDSLRRRAVDWQTGSMMAWMTDGDKGQRTLADTSSQRGSARRCATATSSCLAW